MVDFKGWVPNVCNLELYQCINETYEDNLHIIVKSFSREPSLWRNTTASMNIACDLRLRHIEIWKLLVALDLKIASCIGSELKSSLASERNSNLPSSRSRFICALYWQKNHEEDWKVYRFEVNQEETLRAMPAAVSTSLWTKAGRWSEMVISGAHIPYLFSNTYLLLIYFFLFTSMSNSPHLPKIVKGRPSTVTLQSLYEYIESLEKRREEREVKLQTELEATKNK